MIEIRVSELRQLLQAQCPALIHELVPGARRQGNVFSAPNPTRGDDKRGSFKIWSNGAWKEYDSGEKGDVLGLIAFVNHYEPKSKEGRRFAIQWAKQRLGLETGDRRILARARRQVAERTINEAKEEERRAARIRSRVLDILTTSKPLTLDPENLLMRYLDFRGIDYAAIPYRCPVLRFMPLLKHWTAEDWTGPAMIAAVMSGEGHKTAVHCTFLKHDGLGKAPISPAKLMLGTVKGSVVPLTYGPSGLPATAAAAQGIRGPVILAEGIETGLAMAAAIPECRVWACLSLTNIANAPVHLAAISEIIVAAENDKKPQTIRQREAVLEQLETRGKPVISIRPHVGNDFADLVAKG